MANEVSTVHMTATPGDGGYQENPFPLPNSRIRDRASVVRFRAALYTLLVAILLALLVGPSLSVGLPSVVILAFSGAIIFLFIVDYLGPMQEDLSSRPARVRNGKLHLNRPRLWGFGGRDVIIGMEKVDRLTVKRMQGNAASVRLWLKDGGHLNLGEKRVEEMERLKRYLQDVQNPMKVVMEEG